MNSALPDELMMHVNDAPGEPSHRLEWLAKSVRPVSPGDVLVVASQNDFGYGLTKLCLVFSGNGEQARCFTLIDSQDAYRIHSAKQAIDFAHDAGLVILRGKLLQDDAVKRLSELEKAAPRDFIRLFLSAVGEFNLHTFVPKPGETPCRALLSLLLTGGFGPSDGLEPVIPVVVPPQVPRVEPAISPAAEAAISAAVAARVAAVNTPDISIPPVAVLKENAPPEPLHVEVDQLDVVVEPPSVDHHQEPMQEPHNEESSGGNGHHDSDVGAEDGWGFDSTASQWSADTPAAQPEPAVVQSETVIASVPVATYREQKDNWEEDTFEGMPPQIQQALPYADSVDWNPPDYLQPEPPIADSAVESAAYPIDSIDEAEATPQHVSPDAPQYQPDWGSDDPADVAWDASTPPNDSNQSIGSNNGVEATGGSENDGVADVDLNESAGWSDGGAAGVDENAHSTGGWSNGGAAEADVKENVESAGSPDGAAEADWNESAESTGSPDVGAAEAHLNESAESTGSPDGGAEAYLNESAESTGSPDGAAEADWNESAESTGSPDGGAAEADLNESAESTGSPDVGAAEATLNESAESTGSPESGVADVDLNESSESDDGSQGGAAGMEPESSLQEPVTSVPQFEIEEAPGLDTHQAEGSPAGTIASDEYPIAQFEIGDSASEAEASSAASVKPPDELSESEGPVDKAKSDDAGEPPLARELGALDRLGDMPVKRFAPPSDEAVKAKGDKKLKPSAQIAQGLPGLLGRLEQHVSQASAKVTARGAACEAELERARADILVALSERYKGYSSQLDQHKADLLGNVKTCSDSALGNVKELFVHYEGLLANKSEDFKAQVNQRCDSSATELQESLNVLRTDIDHLHGIISEALERIPPVSADASTGTADSSTTELCSIFRNTVRQRIDRYAAHLRAATSHDLERLDELTKRVELETVAQTAAMSSTLTDLVSSYRRRAVEQRVSAARVAMRSLQSKLLLEFSARTEALGAELTAPLRAMSGQCHQSYDLSQQRMDALEDDAREEFRQYAADVLASLTTEVADYTTKLRNQLSSSRADIEILCDSIVDFGNSADLSEKLGGQEPASYLQEKLKGVFDRKLSEFHTQCDEKLQSLQTDAGTIMASTRTACEEQLTTTREYASMVVEDMRTGVAAVVSEISTAQSECMEKIEQ